MVAFLSICSVHPRIHCGHHRYGRIQSSSTLELWDFIFPKITLVKFMQLLKVRIFYLVPVYHLFFPYYLEPRCYVPYHRERCEWFFCRPLCSQEWGH